MDELFEPEFYMVIPEFNRDGRLCNYGSGDNEKVKVMADEWERFNELAGRQHEIVRGVVRFNDRLEPCLPDDALAAKIEALKEELSATDYKIIKCSEYQLTGQDMPYNIEVLHTERERLRDEINRLEGNG